MLDAPSVLKRVGLFTLKPMKKKETKENQFMQRTIDLWSPLASRQLSKEDAREIKSNVTGFFSVLLEWDLKEKGSLKDKSSN